jgi:hypothetical protein
MKGEEWLVGSLAAKVFLVWARACGPGVGDLWRKEWVHCAIV